jgi:hypothetical protein
MYQPWRNLFNSWLALPRPTSWNGRSARYFPLGLRNRELYSFREYQAYFGKPALVYGVLSTLHFLLVLEFLNIVLLGRLCVVR